jgi:hypothetical protein
MPEIPNATVVHFEDYLYLECPTCSDTTGGIDAGDTLADLVSRVREHYALYHDEDQAPEPCQPIGCDHGYHLPGCAYAAVDSEDQADE